MFAHVVWMRRAEILLMGWVGIGAKHLCAGWKPLEAVTGLLGAQETLLKLETS